jgi:hypothetical protein
MHVSARVSRSGIHRSRASTVKTRAPTRVELKGARTPDIRVRRPHDRREGDALGREERRRHGKAVSESRLLLVEREKRTTDATIQLAMAEGGGSGAAG